MPHARSIALAIGVPLLAASAALAGTRATGLPRRLGASRFESRTPMPGDDLLPDAVVQNDRARLLPASPADVWPWLAQMGQDKAGFYSFEALENALGCQVEGADRIHPDWQDVAVGDPFPLHPDIALRVAEVIPGRALVLTSEGGSAPDGPEFDFTWSFMLRPVPQPGREVYTRLRIRERYWAPRKSTRVMLEAVSYGSAVMTWRMLSRLEHLTRMANP